MIKSIDGAAIAAQVRMERQDKKKKNKSFLILEGSDDIKVFRNFVDHGACETVNAFRKQNVIDAVYLLEDDGCNGMCGIVDADFDAILKVSYDSDNIIATDCHDLDVMIFMSHAFEKYINMVSNDGDVDAFEKRLGVTIRESVTQASRILGAARLASTEKGLNILFRNIDLSEFLDGDLKMNDGIFRHLIDRSTNPRCNARQLRIFSDEILGRQIEGSVLCQGHDLAQVLGVALRKAIGNRKVPLTWGSEIEIGLRLSFDWELFIETKLYELMCNWERQNTPWRMLQSRPSARLVDAGV